MIVIVGKAMFLMVQPKEVQPDVYDVITICIDCRNHISETPVQKYWIKAKCMSVINDIVVDVAIMNITVLQEGFDIVSVLS